ncbi:MAG: hypothetical protein MUQ10_09075 [Anaerolineae bacterium]|nr:hypothetical protein [Anaerolineae bacterium]
MFRKFCQTIVVPGTLTGPVSYTATIPSACTIQHVSLCQSNALGAGRVKMGLSTDDDIFLTYKTMGVSNVPVVLEVPTDFRNSILPHLAAGDILKLYLDHDGASSTAAQDATIVITFTEG